MEIRILKLCTLFPFHKSSHIWKVLHQCLTPSAVQFTNIPTCSLEPQEHRRDSSPLRYTNVWHHWQSNSPTYICSLEPGSQRDSSPIQCTNVWHLQQQFTNIHTSCSLEPRSIRGTLPPWVRRHRHTSITQVFTKIHHIWLGRPRLITNKEVTRVLTSSTYMAIQWSHQLHDLVCKCIWLGHALLLTPYLVRPCLTTNTIFG